MIYYRQTAILLRGISYRTSITHATRKAIQEASATLSTYPIEKRYGLNYRMVQKWHQQDSVEDLQSGTQDPHPKSLSKL